MMRKTLTAFRKTSAALAFTAATCLAGVNPAVAQTCPTAPGQGNLCTAKDFTITSAIVQGPTECTIGDTISVTVRVGLTSTANERYDIGIFTGENGEPVFGGASCSLDALVPLEPPFDGDSGFGGYRNLDGDACGDVSGSDGEIFKDVQLDNVLCEDQDGDGQVDISGVVTWSSNANQDVCTNPDDPSQFFPSSSSKCILDPEFNLPIIVEPPAALRVFKLALPGNLPEPGGNVLFFLDIKNASTGTDTIVVESIIDDVHGDATTTQGNDIIQTSCSVPQVLVAGQEYFCEFVADVTGSAGYVETDTVTVTGRDDEGETVTASDIAQVEIGDSPPSIVVGKSVQPTVVPEPGGEVTYYVVVANESNSETVTIDSFEDDLYGDFFDPQNPKGDCPTAPFTLEPIGVDSRKSIMRCRFTETVTGDFGDPPVRDVITADGPTIDPKSDDAEVSIANVAASIEISKTAIPASLPEPGGTFTFRLQVQNTSPVDDVTIDSALDNVYGNLNTLSTCVGIVGQTLAPSEVYTCSFPGDFFGIPGDSQTDLIVVIATDSDGGTKLDFASADVFIEDVPGSIVVTKTPDVSEQEDGQPVVYTVSVYNSSTVDTVTLNNMQDNPYGDITSAVDPITATDCAVPQVLLPDATYTCSFTVLAAGSVGDRITDTVTITGLDDDSNTVVGSDSAFVDIIDIIAPPSVVDLRVTKVALPSTVAVTDVPFPVAYFVRVNNPNAFDIQITSATDDIYDIFGNDSSKIPVTGLINCPVPFDLAAGASRLCLFTGPVDGAVGDVITDTVIVEACALPGCTTTTSAQDSASVTVTPGPISLSVLKTAQPNTVVAPGGAVDFSVDVINTSSSVDLTITSMSDDIYGDITAVSGDITATDCSTPQNIAANGGQYTCTFTVQVTGVAGTEVVDIVTVDAEDAGGETVTASDSATVEILGELPRIETRKIADPVIVRAPGAMVTFTTAVSNTSADENLTVNSLVDDIYGDLNGRGSCSVPQTILPTDTYRCEFSAQVSGDSAGLHRDTITVEGSDESGDLVADSDWAVVIILPIGDTPLAIPVNPVWLLAIASLAVLGTGLVAIRRRRARV